MAVGLEFREAFCLGEFTPSTLGSDINRDPFCTWGFTVDIIAASIQEQAIIIALQGNSLTASLQTNSINIRLIPKTDEVDLP